MCNNDLMRSNFIKNSVAYLRKHNFDGLELGLTSFSTFKMIQLFEF